MLKFYNRILHTYPILFPSVQTSLLMSAGDFIAQIIVERKSSINYNYLRTAQFAGVGLFMAGPTLTLWYRILARLIGEKGKTIALKKAAVDQLIFAPTFVVAFLSTLGAVQNQTLEITKNSIRKNYKDIMITNYKLWPCVQLVNFYVVPLQYQVLVVQCVALIWNTYLSWKTQQTKEISY